MNILLFVCDTLRADHLGCYGYFRDTSPNIDHIAKEGVLFKDFHCAGAPTGPSFTCTYTGLHSIHHRYYFFTQPNVRQVDDVIFTMPEVLRAWGYTAAAVDNLINFPPHSKHWVRGYDFYIDPSPRAFLFPPLLMAEHVNKRLIPWIKSHSDEKFFLFVHYWDPHTPYVKGRARALGVQPQTYRQGYREIFHHERGDLSDLEVKEAPAGYQYVPGWGKLGEFADGIIEWHGGKFSIDFYDDEIRYMDNAIGEVVSTLERSRILDDTLIIVTSDHGELLSPQNWGHGSLYDAVTHVPLIMRYPKRLPSNLRVEGFGQHIDLLPTLLDIIGASTEALDIDGKSLLPLLNGEVLKDEIFMEQATRKRAVRTEKWKFIHDIMRGRFELYNLENDPLEIENLIETEEDKAEELREKLNSWVRVNLKEGENDPIVYEKRETSELSRKEVKYREKISQLFASFRKSKSEI